MDNLLDDAFHEKQDNQVVFASFWARVWAKLIDTLIILPVVLPLTFYNISTWKSIPLAIAVGAISVIYQPFMEYMYGATLGKMAKRLVVVNYAFEKPDFGAVVMRNIFNIISAVATLVSSVYVFSLADFQNVSDFMEYSVFVSKIEKVGLVNNVVTLVFMIDVLSLLSDKQNRTFHDKIGKTYVVARNSLPD